jgi:plasmid replication initiation protein
MKFYEVKQQLNNLYWQSLGFVRKKEEAEKLRSLYNTKTTVYPTKIVEHQFKSAKDLKG